MDTGVGGHFQQIAASSKEVASRLLTIGENRLELLTVELQEEQTRLVRSLLLALGVAVFGLLAGLALTAALVIWLWNWPLTVLLTLTGLYAAAGTCLYWRLMAMLNDWQTLAATLEQLRKDRACLAKILE